ncbi:MAG: hypothetical protein Q9172_006602 [Xanthocarpia lactea]
MAADDPVYLAASMQYTRDVVITSELLRFTPSALQKYPEYLEPMRREIEEMANNENDKDNYDNMPLMDSFLKETARVYPTVILTMPRKVLWPFKFADGTLVPKDNWIVVPSQALMQDEQFYSEPQRFNGFRFVNSEGKTNSSSLFSTPSFEFPFWGGTKRPCPGRFYVAVAAKMILTRFIGEYDIKLENPKAAASLAWSYALAPHPRTKMLIRKRGSACSGCGHAL